MVFISKLCGSGNEVGKGAYVSSLPPVNEADGEGSHSRTSWATRAQSEKGPGSGSRCSVSLLCFWALNGRFNEQDFFFSAQ